MSDLIDRQAAIDAIAKMMPQSLTPDGSHPADKEIFIAQEAFADCIKTIEILPSAQPKRKTGRWEDINKNYYCRISGRCSACGWEAHLYEDDVVGMPYCPNCGAKMEGKDG